MSQARDTPETEAQHTISRRRALKGLGVTAAGVGGITTIGSGSAAAATTHEIVIWMSQNAKNNYGGWNLVETIKDFTDVLVANADYKVSLAGNPIDLDNNNKDWDWWKNWVKNNSNPNTSHYLAITETQGDNYFFDKTAVQGQAWWWDSSPDNVGVAASEFNTDPTHWENNVSEWMKADDALQQISMAHQEILHALSVDLNDDNMGWRAVNKNGHDGNDAGTYATYGHMDADNKLCYDDYNCDVTGYLTPKYITPYVAECNRTEAVKDLSYSQSYCNVTSVDCPNAC